MTRCWICDGPLAPCARLAPEPFSECERCGFILRPDLDAEALARTYAGGAYEEIRGEQYLSELPDRRRDARVRLGYIQPWAPMGSLLDVGAAGGAFVAEAQTRGYRARGIEPVPSFAAAGREQLGVDVQTTSIEGADLEEESYDIITMWHVLEHVPEPLGQLRRIGAALRPAGILAVEVPNAGSAVALRMGAAWPSLEPNVHVNQFAPETLRLLIERAGLEALDVSTTAITPYLRWPDRLGARHVAGRAKAAVWLKDPRARHPRGHELLRAVARRAAGRGQAATTGEAPRPAA